MIKCPWLLWIIDVAAKGLYSGGVITVDVRELGTLLATTLGSQICPNQRIYINEILMILTDSTAPALSSERRYWLAVGAVGRGRSADETRGMIDASPDVE